MNLQVKANKSRMARSWDWLTVLAIILAHVLLIALFKFSPPKATPPKTSEILVEIGEAPPPVAMVVPPSPPQPALATEPLVEPPRAEPVPALPTVPEPEPKPEPEPEPEPKPEPPFIPPPVPQPKPQPAKPPERKPPAEPAKPVARPSAPVAPSTSPPASSSSGPASTAPVAPSASQGEQTTEPDYKAAYLRNPKPVYPPSALKMRIEGTVILRVLVLEDGSSGKVVLGKSSGNELLDRSALDTVAKWKFKPAQSKGKNVAQWVNVPINFSIKRR